MGEGGCGGRVRVGERGDSKSGGEMGKWGRVWEGEWVWGRVNGERGESERWGKVRGGESEGECGRESGCGGERGRVSGREVRVGGVRGVRRVRGGE